MAQYQLEQDEPLLSNGERRSSQDSFNDLYPTGSLAKQYVLKIAALMHPAHITTLRKRFAYALVPQPLRSYIWNDHGPSPKEFPTSYLNGLRGLTAVKVFTFHYMMVYTDFTFLPFATDKRETNFFALPIIRYVYAGYTAHIFFGIAGYLTSLRLFQLMDRNDASSQAKVLMTISASLFRRGFRLYLPVFIITLITATYIYLGLYEKNRPLLLDHVIKFAANWNEEKPPQFPTYMEQLRFWAQEMFLLTNINSEATVYPLHDQHLWSILSEMRASVHLYGCLVALMHCKRHVRLALLIVVAFIYFCLNHWEIWVYILGAALAQLDIILSDRESSQKAVILLEKSGSLSTHAQNHLYTSDRTYRWVRAAGFVVAFYLLSFPIFGYEHYCPGYETLKLFIPEWMDRKDKFYANLGTIMLLFLLIRSNPQTSKWRKLLMSPIPQYLGSISFGLYLVQALLLHIYGYLIPQWIWWSFGVEGKQVGNTAWIIPILIGWFVSVLTAIWVADVWTREVEGRCVLLVKWLENLCFKQY